MEGMAPTPFRQGEGERGSHALAHQSLLLPHRGCSSVHADSAEVVMILNHGESTEARMNPGEKVGDEC